MRPEFEQKPNISAEVELLPNVYWDIQLYLRQHPDRDLSWVINAAAATFCEPQPQPPFSDLQEAA